LNDFSVVEAFTPGNEKAVSFESPIEWGFDSTSRFSPRRERLGYGKTFTLKLEIDQKSFCST
jgi:hypothetical protein